MLLNESLKSASVFVLVLKRLSQYPARPSPPRIRLKSQTRMLTFNSELALISQRMSSATALIITDTPMLLKKPQHNVFAMQPFLPIETTTNLCSFLQSHIVLVSEKAPECTQGELYVESPRAYELYGLDARFIK